MERRSRIPGIQQANGVPEALVTGMDGALLNIHVGVDAGRDGDTGERK
jgi:hypothetical protein